MIKEILHKYNRCYLILGASCDK